ncbi:MAG: hypothetical protein H0W89_01275 [Candidatus Levybacteria bacterium]|nr:hypothetical protein [Candidatus Levybacteria bacterium]
MKFPYKQFPIDGYTDEGVGIFGDSYWLDIFVRVNRINKRKLKIVKEQARFTDAPPEEVRRIKTNAAVVREFIEGNVSRIVGLDNSSHTK